MKLSNIPFSPEHLDQIELKPVFHQERQGMKERITGLTKRPHSFSSTILGPKGPIAVVGITLFHPGSGECWSVLGTEIDRSGIAFARLVARMISTYERFLKLRRLQILARDGHPEVIKWAGFLGFQCEGRLRKYGLDGSDYFMYARVR